MTTPVKLLAPLLCASLCCCGTLGTRFMRTQEGHAAGEPGWGGDFCGAYPFAALVDDFGLIGEGAGYVAHPDSDAFNDAQAEVGLGVFAVLFGLVSLPVDLVLDTLFLPADLIGWSMGMRKARVSE